MGREVRVLRSELPAHDSRTARQAQHRRTHRRRPGPPAALHRSGHAVRDGRLGNDEAHSRRSMAIGVRCGSTQDEVRRSAQRRPDTDLRQRLPNTTATDTHKPGAGRPPTGYPLPERRFRDPLRPARQRREGSVQHPPQSVHPPRALSERDLFHRRARRPFAHASAARARPGSRRALDSGLLAALDGQPLARLHRVRHRRHRRCRHRLRRSRLRPTAGADTVGEVRGDLRHRGATGFRVEGLSQQDAGPLREHGRSALQRHRSAGHVVRQGTRQERGRVADQDECRVSRSDRPRPDGFRRNPAPAPRPPESFRARILLARELPLSPLEPGGGITARISTRRSIGR